MDTRELSTKIEKAFILLNKDLTGKSKKIRHEFIKEVSEDIGISADYLYKIGQWEEPI